MLRIIVYMTGMNIVHSLSTYSRVQSENDRKIEQDSARELVVVGSALTVYNRIYYSYG